MTVEAIQGLHDRFKAHAECCPGCTTSLEVGTWLGYRCPTGKRMAWELVDLLGQRGTGKAGEES